jgi:hypothetical protein
MFVIINKRAERTPSILYFGDFRRLWRATEGGICREIIGIERKLKAALQHGLREASPFVDTASTFVSVNLLRRHLR